MDYLSRWMLVTMRAFVIKHKAIFRLAVIAYAKILLEPTKDNTLEPNSHILLDIRDKFFEHYTLPDRRTLFESAWKIFICEYEHDPHYRHIGDWLIEELVESVMSGEWKPRPIGEPSGWWKEPRYSEGNYGGNRGRKFAELINKTNSNLTN